jgi:hypothetical protein
MPPTRHRLGEPLPHQQADRPQTHPKVDCSFTLKITLRDYRELVRLSADYARLWGW